MTTIVDDLSVRLIYEEIDRIRELRGIPSRDALARMAGIHEQHLYQIFSGKRSPTVKTLGKLCRALNCQPGDILFYDPEGEDDIEPDR